MALPCILEDVPLSTFFVHYTFSSTIQRPKADIMRYGRLSSKGSELFRCHYKLVIDREYRKHFSLKSLDNCSRNKFHSHHENIFKNYNNDSGDFFEIDITIYKFKSLYRGANYMLKS